MILLNKTLRLFLDGIGRREEYEFYLNRFQAGTSPCFAVLYPDLSTLEQAADMLAFDLQFLLQLELAPLILLCGAEAERGPALLTRHAAELYSVHPVNEKTSPSDLCELVQTTQQAGRVPVLSASGCTPPDMLPQMLPELARRVHFIRAEGGLKSPFGEPLFYCNTVHAPTPTDPADADWATLGGRLIERLPGVHVSLTSSMNLLREIFTVRGAGTVFRRGCLIRRCTDRAQVDFAALEKLLLEAFGRPLKNPAQLLTAAEWYMEEEGRGAAVLESHPCGHYLSKFGVGAEARGEGLAQDLWREIRRHCPALFWRSRADNPVNQWYARMADGGHRTGSWWIYWAGVRAEDIPRIIAFCATRPEDFMPASEGGGVAGST